ATTRSKSGCMEDPLKWYTHRRHGVRRRARPRRRSAARVAQHRQEHARIVVLRGRARDFHRRSLYRLPRMEDFAGRVVIVTGAWRGLGRAAAERFHDRGASVAVNVRSRDRAESLAADLGERALAVSGDVAAPGVAEEIV